MLRSRSVLEGYMAFLATAGVLFVALRNLKYAPIGLIPNLAPALSAFGIWGICVGYVGFAVWTVAAMSLGFVVDDIAYYLSKYTYARRLGPSPPEAVRFAFHTVGSASVVTSVILSAGFLIVSFSSFKVNSDVGLLTLAVILCALVADFLLLPLLLLWLDRDTGSTTTPTEDAE